MAEGLIEGLIEGLVKRIDAAITRVGGVNILGKRKFLCVHPLVSMEIYR